MKEALPEKLSIDIILSNSEQALSLSYTHCEGKQTVFNKRALNISPVTAFFRTAKSALAAAVRAIITISHPGSTGNCRVMSLSRRFTLFLTTALPTLLLTEYPYLVFVQPLGSALITTKPLTHDPPFA